MKINKQHVLTYREKLGLPLFVDPGIDCSVDAPMTEQAHAPDCDINAILNKFLKTGNLPQDTRQALNGDFTKMPDYITALNTIREADEVFMALPAQTRIRFENNPAKFCEFVENPKNGKELVEMGFAIKRPDDAPLKPTKEAPVT